MENPSSLPLQELPEQYELLGKVNQGGMGTIFKAKNRYTDTFFAIKVMCPESADDSQALQRFILEAKSASSLKHPNICQVHDFGLTRSRMPYLVMDWINGISLADEICNKQRIPVQDGLRIFQQIATALAHAHQHHVVHRDLKPENIMLSLDPGKNTQVHVVDFGIAKVLSNTESGLTQIGIAVGTPMFMSPEQARAETIDGRSDIYSLGCLMYFALVGKPPFVGSTAIDTITKQVTEPPPKVDSALGIPADLKRIMLKAMEKDPRDRYQKMEQLATDLRKLAKGVSLEHQPLSTERRAVRKKLVIGLCFILGFIITYALSLGLQNILDSANLDTSNKLSNSQSHPQNH